jgi:hypothetical protein
MKSNLLPKIYSRERAYGVRRLMLGFMLLTPLFSRSLYSFDLCYQLSWCIDVFCSRTKANSDVIFLI